MADARQRADAGRRTRAQWPERASDGAARCAGRGDHRCGERSRRDARARLRACAGALFRDGSDAPRVRGRTVGIVRIDRDREGQGTARAPHPRAGRGRSRRDGRGQAPAARSVYRRRQCWPRRAARAAMALSAATTGAEALGTGRRRAHRFRDVFRSAGRRQSSRTGDVEDQAAPAARAVRPARARRQPLGRTALRYRARRRAAADRRSGRPAQAVGATGRAARRRGRRHRARQQQFRGRGCVDCRRSGHRRRRHASGPARAQPLVPRAPALRRRARAGRQGRYHRLHPARPAHRRGGQQHPRRLGVHQQLRRHRRLEDRNRLR